MRRAILCPIIETAGEDGLQEFNPKLPPMPEGAKVYPKYRCDTNGVPRHTHCLVIVEAEDFTAIDADETIEKLDRVLPCDEAELARLMARPPKP